MFVKLEMRHLGTKWRVKSTGTVIEITGVDLLTNNVTVRSDFAGHSFYNTYHFSTIKDFCEMLGWRPNLPEWF